MAADEAPLLNVVASYCEYVLPATACSRWVRRYWQCRLCIVTDWRSPLERRISVLAPGISAFQLWPLCTLRPQRSLPAGWRQPTLRASIALSWDPLGVLWDALVSQPIGAPTRGGALHQVI